jgi:hypothetical protein
MIERLGLNALDDRKINAVLTRLLRLRDGTISEDCGND